MRNCIRNLNERDVYKESLLEYEFQLNEDFLLNNQLWLLNLQNDQDKLTPNDENIIDTFKWSEK